MKPIRKGLFGKLHVPVIFALLVLAATFCYAKTVIVTASETSLRSQPGNSKKVIAKLKRFTPVTIKQRKGDWTQVSLSDSKSGWLRSSSLGSSRFVSIKTQKANCRQGPGTKYDILFKFGYGYPLKVLEKKGDWQKVADCEGDSGWIHDSQISTERFVIVRLKQVNVRSGPGTENKILFKAERGVVFRMLGDKNGWVRIKHEDGDEGWVAGNIVWGYRD